MLGKLLKYDLKWCFKPLIVFYILALFFACIVRIVESFNQTLILIIIDKICCGIVIAMIANILINCFMRNWVRFVRNMYKDEAYLTHTLPVSKNKIYLSKILTAVITLITSFLVIILCLMVAILNKDTWNILKESMENAAIYFDTSVFSVIFVTIITIFFEFLFMELSGILGIIIGHKSNNLKIVKSIIVGFLVYAAFSLASVGILYVVGTINADIMDIFNNAVVSAIALKSTLKVGIIIYVIYSVVIYYVGNRMLNKGVNVD